MPALDWMLPHVPVSAEDLDCFLGHPHGGLAGEQLGHRSFATIERLAVATHPGGTPDEEPRSVDARSHVSELEGDGLVLDDGPTKLPALPGVVERVLVGRPGDSQGLSTNHRPRRLERAEGGLATGALSLASAGELLVESLLAAKQATPRNANVVEDDLCGMAGADAVL